METSISFVILLLNFQVLVLNNKVQMVMSFSNHVKSRIRDCRFNVMNGQQLLVPVFCMGFYKIKLRGFHFGAQNPSNVL